MCWTCKGYGHTSKDCPKGKGKGKDFYGKGKGYGDYGKGYGTGYGIAKGYGKDVWNPIRHAQGVREG